MDGRSSDSCVEESYRPWSEPLVLGRPPWGEALQEAYFNEAEAMPAGAPAQLNMSRFTGHATIVLPGSESLRVGRYLWLDMVAEVTTASTDVLTPRRFSVRHGFPIRFAERHGVHARVFRQTLQWLGRAGFIEIQAFVSDTDTKPAQPQSRTRCLFINHSQEGMEPVLPQATGDTLDLRHLERAPDSPFPYLCVKSDTATSACREGWLETYSPHGHAFGRFTAGADNSLPLLLNDHDAGKFVVVYFHTIYPGVQGQLASVSNYRKLEVVTGRAG